ncbi:MAG: hypothetical protein LAT62_13440 [Natronospirillum sp.]|uniref:hypothetical protein n=1 Tax=Natronospirillum sp. TaxID=2812955 RepID=UPI0025EE2873|nr:hypothetical protein [Natronospirillum sp.]MCH8552937.1 hypothetical protein [Natronospirillum sp.]
MEPLRINFGMRTPMADPPDLFHLDALLGALKVKAVERESGQSVNPRDHHYDIPVARYTAASGEWVFKASSFIVQRHFEPQVWMQTGRLNTTTAAEHKASGWLNERGKKPNPAGGSYKSSIYHTMVSNCDLTAYCVGDRAGVEELLTLCEQVGARRGVGFGLVKNITVECVAESDCAWYQRAMPMDAEEAFPDQDYAVATGALQAPYWDRTRAGKILVPA